MFLNLDIGRAALPGFHFAESFSAQIAVLTCMRKVISSAMTPLFSNLTLVAQQQGAGVHKHSSQLSSLQAPQHPHPSAHVALKQAQAEHQVTVEQQEQLLQHWKVLGLQQGIITINCLTLKQITAFIAVGLHDFCWLAFVIRWCRVERLSWACPG